MSEKEFKVGSWDVDTFLKGLLLILPRSFKGMIVIPIVVFGLWLSLILKKEPNLAFIEFAFSRRVLIGVTVYVLLLVAFALYRAYVYEAYLWFRVDGKAVVYFKSTSPEKPWKVIPFDWIRKIVLLSNGEMLIRYLKNNIGVCGLESSLTLGQRNEVDQKILIDSLKKKVPSLQIIEFSTWGSVLRK